MSLPEMIARAAAGTSAMVQSIDVPDLQSPTPCSDWNLEELANHLTGFLPYSANAARRGAQLEGDAPNFAAHPDWADRFAALAADVGVAWSEPGALDGTVQFGPGDLPAQYAAGITLMEIVIHGWDLARATGAPYSVDDDVAAAVAEIVAGANRSAPEGFFGTPVEPPSGASVLETAIAGSGRDPATAA